MNRGLIANVEIFVKNQGQWQLPISVQDSDLLVPLYTVDAKTICFVLFFYVFFFVFSGGKINF